MERRVVVAAAVARGRWGMGLSFLCVWRNEEIFVFVLGGYFSCAFSRFGPHVRSLLFFFGPLQVLELLCAIFGYWVATLCLDKSHQ